MSKGYGGHLRGGRRSADPWGPGAAGANAPLWAKAGGGGGVGEGERSVLRGSRGASGAPGHARGPRAGPAAAGPAPTLGSPRRPGDALTPGQLSSESFGREGHRLLFPNN